MRLPQSPYTELDLATWSRREHFDFFSGFSEPYFQVCVPLKLHGLFQVCKAQGLGFSHHLLYALQQSIQGYAPMRYRLQDNKPVCVDFTHISAVVLGDDDGFRFAYLANTPKRDDFVRMFVKQKEDAMAEGLFSKGFHAIEGRLDMVHVSILPWLDFTGFRHATDAASYSQGIPKCVFGKVNSDNDTMPFALDVHHALLDGVHVGRFVAAFEAECQKLAVALGAAR